MLKIFTVYDSPAEAYLQPFYAQATGAGLRIFIEAASNTEHQFNKHAADYTLFEIGEWDELAGKLTAFKSQKNLGTALQLQEVEQQEWSPKSDELIRRAQAPVMGGE